MRDKVDKTEEFQTLFGTRPHSLASDLYCPLRRQSGGNIRYYPGSASLSQPWHAAQGFNRKPYMSAFLANRIMAGQV